ncbi:MULTISPECIES: DAK2 domain-containing protein [Eubacteriales]|jgi:DAK2 domain fusion protein YloV|uniref:DAK2 domain-containing protein n=1 Tax=Eubacteriales TaxID=186802 RepID=UPI000E422A0C|nr:MULTISPECIES: DAK2 domain-containing protein [Eubacteriales]RGD97547.1 DAK2 domain-containing protein [Clostridium sp. AM25-23AC]RGE15413.1 DAK2 domain-containing protein [Desulfotomaculum sp. OF05-3]
MELKSVDAALLQKAVLAAAKGLEAKKEWINELNVFPVPDGDTGTNMTMTIMAAAREVAAIENPTMESIAKALSSGSLRGARGNSGVILSQLFRGFTKEIKESNEITVTSLANAFTRATETAYKAVMKPKEGTILTVAKGMAEKAVDLATQTDDVIDFLTQVIEEGDYVLSQTPEMLPVLKQAGVVDSGGQGLMQVMKGGLDGLLGRGIPFDTAAPAAGNTESTKPKVAAGSDELSTSDIKYGYCTEFIVNVEKTYDMDEEQKFKGYLESIGDCVVVVSDDDIIKVHVHTNHPGLAFEKGLTYGSLSRMKIDNMREEHHERLIQNASNVAQTPETPAEAKKEEAPASNEPRKPYGFIAVSIGKGLGEIFKGIGADYLIEGGQTMNPSTEDMLNAIEKVNADVIYILPNNKNIILAAEQAKSLVEDKKIFVVPSKTVPQGIAALINFLPDLSPEENLENMTSEMGRIHTGQITYAVRNTNIDGMEIHEGDIMGIGDSGMLAVGQNVNETVLETLKRMVEDESELISVYFGEDVTEEDAEALVEKVQTAFPNCEVELNDGGQPIYYYLLSVE